ncbi:hypothetical protein [Acidithrix ferrooxidans]|uniref:hypothetical protein n=1 Tax=Acidithrix ferrooxidans TaxID=1280514 RepID=UPI001364C795|nr:hypothetical protein [Acidithrix ferrooxidans]
MNANAVWLALGAIAHNLARFTARIRAITETVTPHQSFDGVTFRSQDISLVQLEK